MNSVQASIASVVVVETTLQFSLDELSRACGVESAVVESLVMEGVLTPLGDRQTGWRFEGSLLPRARRATRLLQGLELGAPEIALIMDLFDEIEVLRSQLRRLGG
jgi:hypothetical protein